MIFTEWNWDDAKEVWQEEAKMEGRREGRREGMDEVFALLKKGMSVEEAEKILLKKHSLTGQKI
jgi:hypothetical protein